MMDEKISCNKNFIIQLHQKDLFLNPIIYNNEEFHHRYQDKSNAFLNKKSNSSGYLYIASITVSRKSSRGFMQMLI
jgi:hypothetical protein